MIGLISAIVLCHRYVWLESALTEDQALILFLAIIMESAVEGLLLIAFAKESK